MPAAAYRDVTLTHLDGSGYLSGDYATVVSETGNPAYSPTNTFRYTCHQDEFEQVINGEVHHDGQIWSRALWDIRQALGNVKADTIILRGSFDFPGTYMPDLANRTAAAARQLYGTAAATAVTKAFADRGIL
jgi:Zn-dependent metalloprotease